jgi:hypothetical protein
MFANTLAWGGDFPCPCHGYVSLQRRLDKTILKRVERGQLLTLEIISRGMATSPMSAARNIWPILQPAWSR